MRAAAFAEAIRCCFQHQALADRHATQRGHVFLATGLTQQATEREATEQDMVCREIPLTAFEAMVRDGTVQEAMTLSAFALLRLKGML